MKTSSQIKIGTILSYAQIAVGILVNLFYTPVMIRLLGQSEYGLYNTVSSVISMLSLLSLGFNSGYIKYYAQYKKEDDTDGIYRLNGLFLIIFSIIGVTALLCGAFLTMHLDYVFSTGLTDTEYQIAKVLMTILTLNLAISFPMSIFSNIISAHEKFVVLKLLSIIKTVLGPLLTLPLLLMGYRSIAMVSVSTILSVVTDSLYVFYCIKKLKIKFRFRNIEKGLFKNLTVFTIFIAINLLVDQINHSIDKVLLGRFQGTAMVAVYSAGFTINNCYIMLSTAISGMFTPKIHNIVNQTKKNQSEQKKELTEWFIKVGRMQFMVLALVASGMVLFGKAFIVNFWVGEGYEQSYYIALLLMLPGTIPLTQNLGIEIQRAQNNHQFRSIIYLLMAIINLTVSIYLCQIYGAVGCAFGTSISILLANGLMMNIFYHKRCNIDMISFWKTMMSAAKGLIIPAIAGVLLITLIPQESIYGFAGAILAYSLIYAVSMWKVAMNQEEKELVYKVRDTVLKKFK